MGNSVTQKTINVKYLSTIKEFFTFGDVQQHLNLLDDWLEIACSNSYYKKNNSPADLLYRHQHLAALFEAAYLMYETRDRVPGSITGTFAEQEKFLATERSREQFYPTSISRKVMATPLCILDELFAQRGLAYYKTLLFEWLIDGLSGSSSPDGKAIATEAYNVTRELVAACWLVHIRENNRPVPGNELAQTTSLDALVNFITTVIPVQFIFCLHQENGSADLMVVLDQHCERNFADLHPLLEFAAAGYPRVTCTLHNFGVLNELIQQQKLFYLNRCSAYNCIYRKQNEVALPQFFTADINAVTEQLLPVFSSGLGKAIDFYNGALHYIQIKALTLVPFMLQQACELTYRIMLTVMKGSDIKTHELTLLRKQLKRFAPELIGVFAEDEQEELAYLRTLEAAYINSRYQQQEDMPVAELVLLAEKTNLLQQKAIAKFKGYLQPHHTGISGKINAFTEVRAEEVWF